MLDPGPLIREVETLVRETFPGNITVEVFLAADLWPVRANATELHQVLLNLCVNARDAMPAGGRLSFAADNVTLDEAAIAAGTDLRPGDHVSLLVADTGTGMPAEVKARIFEPFFSTKAEGRGTGIGLATVARIVKGHGGGLRVDSTPGEGATFEVLLPRATAVVETGPSVPAAALPRGQGELILVVDDEQAIRDLAAEGLTAHGYRVLVAGDGPAAIRLFEGRMTEVAAVVCDTSMPGLDGAQTAAALQQLRPGLPVILASGDTPGTAGGDGGTALRKPFTLEQMLAAVEAALHSPGGR